MGHHQRQLDPTERLTLGKLSPTLMVVWFIVGIVAIVAAFGLNGSFEIPDYSKKDKKTEHKDHAHAAAGTSMISSVGADDHDDHAHDDHDGHAHDDHAGHEGHDHDEHAHAKHDDHGHAKKEKDPYAGKPSKAEPKMFRFWMAYVVAYCFGLSFCLGGMFFVIVMYMTRAGWSVTSRRIAENMAKTVPLFAVLAVPILIAMHQGWLYNVWVTPKEGDLLVLGKVSYLNPTFFTIRYMIYFAIWIGLAIVFCGLSRKQDETKDWRITGFLQNAAAPGLILFGTSITFFAFDTIMSLDPHWFSTMFGVYYFAGTMGATFAFIILTAMAMQAKGVGTTVINTEHYHDLGKFLFAFVVFWAYIAYSQYMLIWYANFYETTIWFIRRGAFITQNSGVIWDSYNAKMHKQFKVGESWRWVPLVLLFGHFIIPFLGLMSRYMKRMKPTLGFWAVVVILMHWLDMVWLVMPELGRPVTQGDWAMCALLSIGVFALFKGMFALVSGANKPMIPVGDPRLTECLNFRNY